MTRVPDIERLDAFLVELNRASAEVVLPLFRAENELEEKGGAGGFDPVTAADRGAEAVIRRMIGAEFPESRDDRRGTWRGSPPPDPEACFTPAELAAWPMKALRHPARALLVPYGFGSRPHALLLCSCSPKRSRGTWRSPAGLDHLVGRRPCPAGCTRGHVRDLTGSLAIRPMPLPGSRTPAEPTRPRPWRSCRCCPRPLDTQGLRDINFEADTGLQHPLSTLQERRRRQPRQDSLPAGGLRLCREGVEPSGPLRKVSGHITVLLPRA
jgi:hypothetical protein